MSRHHRGMPPKGDHQGVAAALEVERVRRRCPLGTAQPARTLAARTAHGLAGTEPLGPAPPLGAHCGAMAAKAPIDTAHRTRPTAAAGSCSRWPDHLVADLGTLPHLAMSRQHQCRWKARARRPEVTTNDRIDPSRLPASPWPSSGQAGGEREITSTARATASPESSRARWPGRRPQTPLVKPADRSISPSSRTNTRPMRDHGDRGALGAAGWRSCRR